jgi:hypothetical protein
MGVIFEDNDEDIDLNLQIDLSNYEDAVYIKTNGDIQNY